MLRWPLSAGDSDSGFREEEASPPPVFTGVAVAALGIKKDIHTLGEREELREVLYQYMSDTLSYIETGREFCDRHSKWNLQRETEVEMMKDIKDRADNIDLKFDHIKQATNKMKALGEYLMSGLTQMTADSRREELEKELGAVLKDTLDGLQKLDHFLDAVERLAVTSLFVFAEESPFSRLCRGTSPASVRAIITAARQARPLLIHFKRDAAAFFLPSLFNVEVLAFQLDRYISITQQLCDRMEKKLMMIGRPQAENNSTYISPLMSWSKNNENPEVDFGGDLSDESMQNMLHNLKQLSDNRMNKHLRLVSLFQEGATDYISLFSKSQPRMLQFLTELEERAVKLDKMKLGAKISSVAGSSVGATGGVLTIVGLALAPVTAGVSLALTMTGVGLGITSGVNSLVTSVTEVAVNSTHQKKANEVFHSFIEDVQNLQECLENVASERVDIVEEEVGTVLGAGIVQAKAGTIGKGIDSMIDCASAVPILKSEEVIASAGNLPLQEGKAFRNMPSVASDILIGQMSNSLVTSVTVIDSMIDCASAVQNIVKSVVVVASAGNVALKESKAFRNIPTLASDIPDIGKVAKGTPLALSKSARAGFIALNALFIGLDVFFICKDSISLANGSKSEVSQLIRARAALLRSEMDSWQRIHDSLCKGLLTSEESQRILEMPFYPAEEMPSGKKQLCMIQ